MAWNVSKPEQYINYMSGLLQGDLGVSLKQKGRTANDIISQPSQSPARLGGISILVRGSRRGLGSVAAMCRGKWGDQLIMVVFYLGIAVPSFCCSDHAYESFCVELKWLPTMGLSTSHPLYSPGIYSCLLSNGLYYASDALQYVGCLESGLYSYSRAKGVSKFKMLLNTHCVMQLFRLSLMPAPLLAFTVSGSFVVEKIYNIPGLGRGLSTVSPGVTIPW